MGSGSPNSISGERNAVHRKAGEPVDPSGPGLKEPTLPLTAERTSEAHLNPCQGAQRSGGDPLQSKGGGVWGRSPISAEGAVPFPSSDSDEISKLAEFFLLLDAWDRRRDEPPIM